MIGKVSITMILAFLVSLLASSPLYAGQFTTNCKYSHSNSGDPIAYPDSSMSHLHDFFGNDTTDQDSTLESLQEDPKELESNPSLDQCDRDKNKSSYWVPRLFWGGEEIVPTDTGAYYRTMDGLDPANVDNIPLGFKAIAYAPAATQRSDGTELNEGSKARIFWHCNQRLNINESKTIGESTPPTDCPPDKRNSSGNPTLGVTVEFPECWNGNNFNVKGGANLRHAIRKNGKEVCPSNFPRELPQLNMAIDYELPSTTGGISVATMDGMRMGHKHFHADYFNAEDLDRLTAICIRKEPSNKEVPEECRHGG